MLPRPPTNRSQWSTEWERTSVSRHILGYTHLFSIFYFYNFYVQWSSCNFNSNIPTDVVYLDYSKCFDKVCDEKLLCKLSRYGITGFAFNWIRAFLVDRVKSVLITEYLCVITCNSNIWCSTGYRTFTHSFYATQQI